MQGYGGIKKYPGPNTAAGHQSLVWTLEQLVQLYDAWGTKDEADKWRKELGAVKESEKPKEK